MNFDTEILPTRRRVTCSSAVDYPNRITMQTLTAEMRERIDYAGFTPVQAFLTVADGVRNWQAHEENDESV